MKADELARRLEEGPAVVCEIEGQHDDRATCIEAAALIRSQAAEIERLREALNPFAWMILPQSEAQASYPDTMVMQHPFPYPGSVLTLGHFRRARAAMEASNGD